MSLNRQLRTLSATIWTSQGRLGCARRKWSGSLAGPRATDFISPKTAGADRPTPGSGELFSSRFSSVVVVGRCRSLLNNSPALHELCQTWFIAALLARRETILRRYVRLSAVTPASYRQQQLHDIPLINRCSSYHAERQGNQPGVSPLDVFNVSCLFSWNPSTNVWIF